MYPCSCLMTGCRRAALPLVFSVLLLPAPAVQAQRLLTLVSGVGEASSSGDPGPSIGPPSTAVQVDLELLRGAPARLEVPTPEGGVLSAQQSVFEDRGGGDLMWSGGQRGAGYDTVVLTVEGGRLVGWFGAAGGGAYQIHAERDGRGGMAPLGGPGLDAPVPLCGVDAGTEDGHDAHAHAAAAAFAADPSRRVSNPQSHDRLDILVAYTATAAENWANRGGAHAAIRHAGDYLKMVFRNNNLPVEPHIVHIAQASAALDRAGRDLRVPRSGLIGLIQKDGDLRRLRHRHRADLVHLFTGEGPALLGNPCGQHFLLAKGYTARRFSNGGTYGWTSNGAYCDYVATFVHELGHGLGANHEPPVTKLPQRAYTPYAFGYMNWDVMPNIGTAMSNSVVGQIEPFFSTPRIRPYGAVVGIADSQDNERTLQETVQMGVRYSDYLQSVEGLPAPPSNLRVWLDGESARLAWQDNAPGAHGYEVRYSGTNSYSGWFNTGTSVLVEGRTGATVPLEYREPGTVYLFGVQATKGEERSLESSLVGLAFPDELEAPSDVSVAANDVGINVQWADNSDNEQGFVVLILDDGEPVARKWAWADRTKAEILRFRVRPHDAEYQVKVYAANSSAYSEGSEAVTFRWERPLAPAAVTDVAATAIGPTTVRVTWTGYSENDGYWVEASLPGWRYSVHADTEWVDIEGLARGGSYSFRVRAHNRDGASVPSWAYLTLGTRGIGPAAPSNLAWVPEGDEGHWARLSWKDNSRDELGFEVQSGSFRLATVPPDTESAVISIGHLRPGFGGVRVYAYNERGFSARSNRVSSGPGIGGLIATAGDTEAELRWDMWSAEAVTGMQARWKATADLPFDDALDTWTDLPATARAYTVTGLKNGTKYMFAVRYVTASGAGPAATAEATPRDPPSPPRVPPKASFTVSVDCSDDPCRVRTGEEIRFTDTSTGEVTERNWDFGDGATSDLKSPTHAWSTPGFYTVTLTVSDGSSSDSATRTVLVEAPPPAPLIASFRLDVPCDEELCRTLTGTLVSFVDTSTGNVTEWRWSFGDGATSDLRSPTHAWSTPGFYDVTLTVSDGSSSASASRTVLVSGRRLEASFRLDIPCDEDLCRTLTGAPVSFLDTSGGNVTEWRWSFGDGAASNLRSPTHAWTTPGFYDVTLTVSDGSSSASASRTVLVSGRRLEASFRLDIPCEEDLCRTFTDAPVSFVDTSGGNVTEWRWSFGDGAASNLRSPTHAWSTPGFYTVTLTVSDGSSSDSASRTVLVAGRRLEASFRLDIPCDEDLCRTLTGAPVSFVDTSGGNVTEWRWSFGDGAASNLRSPTHAWSSPGFYDVTLTVSDGSSSDSATRTVLVEAAAPAGSCRADAETLCLRDSRFEVKANWWSADGESGPGRVVYAGTNDSGLFRFFGPLNWEILIKVLDGCGINGRMWVLGAATTDLGYRILVTDTVTGESRSYVNEPGRPAPAIVDTEAFPGACSVGAGP